MLKQQDNLAVDLISTDIDDQSLMLDGWEQKYTQLETGSFEAKTFSLNVCDNLNIFRKYTNRRMHKFFVCPGNAIRLAAVLPGSDASLFQGREIIAGDLFVLKPGIESELVCRGKFDVAVIELESNLIYRSYNNNEQLDIQDVLHKQVTCGFSDKIYSAFLQRKMNSGLFSSICAPAIRALCYEEPSHSKQNSQDVVTKAIQLVEHCLEDLDELPKISEISAHLGVSERALEYAFARKYGISPIRYFKFIRLHGARRDIRIGKLSVTDVAMKWGFSHLGRFSNTYRETFGELPSHTK
ncbi:helix-turn-helix transcriptional regulator [Colwellia sp. E150_009]